MKKSSCAVWWHVLDLEGGYRPKYLPNSVLEIGACSTWTLRTSHQTSICRLVCMAGHTDSPTKPAYQIANSLNINITCPGPKKQAFNLFIMPVMCHVCFCGNSNTLATAPSADN